MKSPCVCVSLPIPPLHYLSPHFHFFHFLTVAGGATAAMSLLPPLLLSVSHLRRSIFARESDQVEEAQYTSVNKGCWPGQCVFTACLHWDMMLRQWLSGALILVLLWFHQRRSTQDDMAGRFSRSFASPLVIVFYYAQHGICRVFALVQS